MAYKNEMKIKILKNGPYLVSGGVPLLEQVITTDEAGHTRELLDVKVVCLSEIRDGKLFFLSVYANGKVQSNAGQCELSITPCSTVENDKDIRVYDRVSELFPEAKFLINKNP